MNFPDNSDNLDMVDRALMIVHETRLFIRREDAMNLFENARDKLLNINQWNHLMSTDKTSFQLTDSNGHFVDGPAQCGLYVRVDIAGKGASIGYGYDWLIIENCFDKNDQEDNDALFSFNLKPSVNPEQMNGQVAHYFSDSSSLTVLLRRDENQVKVSVYENSLNINPLAEKSVAGIVRQSLVGNAGICGLKESDWEQSIVSLLELDKPKFVE